MQVLFIVHIFRRRPSDQIMFSMFRYMNWVNKRFTFVRSLQMHVKKASTNLFCICIWFDAVNSFEHKHSLAVHCIYGIYTAFQIPLKGWWPAEQCTCWCTFTCIIYAYWICRCFKGMECSRPIISISMINFISKSTQLIIIVCSLMDYVDTRNHMHFASLSYVSMIFKIRTSFTNRNIISAF